VNCAALPEPLLESELFGHAARRVLGAANDRAGLFVRRMAAPSSSTEIGDLPFALQGQAAARAAVGEVRPVERRPR
jgi:transcriptional regulator with GAF, ATPase, and Fis domain